MIKSHDINLNHINTLSIVYLNLLYFNFKEYNSTDEILNLLTRYY
jgi:hypothetical protein